jgi:hypothetical protein
MYLARKHTDMSFPEIGRFMGDKNHSTVILANRRIAQLVESDEKVRRMTPAGVQEECIREIISRIERELGKAVAADKPMSLPFTAAAPTDSREPLAVSGLAV